MPVVFGLGLVDEDRLGVVSKLTKMLAERGISIESIPTGIVRSGVSGKQRASNRRGLRGIELRRTGNGC
jgi:glycine cleavage system regulatory protein